MEKRLLITPGNSSVGAALAERAELDSWKVALAGGASASEPGENRRIIPYNERSLLSARKMLLDCVNSFQSLDAAIVLHEARQDERPVHELSPVAIEEYIDTRLKGVFFMVREILSLFVRQGSGILAMVSYIPEEFTLLPLCAAATAAFRATTDSLCMLYQNENIVINGFECANRTPERFSRFVLELLSGKAGETSGKWYRFGGSMSRVFRK